MQNRKMGFVGLVLLGFVALIGLPIVFLLQQNFRSNAGITYATVVETWIEGTILDTHGPTRMVRFRYTVGGVEFEAIRPYRDGFVGQQIRLYYDVDNPRTFQLEQPRQWQILFLTPLLAGGLFLMAFQHLRGR